jgi:wyosine [tRNA(Phe)-imidazoG37] synthetase (radical SAM superfamily)
MAYVFGPVPSRRLGRSLGVDLVPFKTCPYDCIYCQLGATTHKTDQRQTLAPLNLILDELRDKIAAQPDYITLGGSGEPTLYQDLGPLIRAIKAFTDIPVAVLTNGSLLWRQELRSSLLQADLVVPSLDAGSEATFQAVNRPVDGLAFETMLEGLIAFRDEFRGAYWLEIFLLAGYTDHEEEVLKMAACARRIRPDRIQLNTVSRPPTESFAEPVPPDRMAYFAGLFQPEAEVIAEYPDSAPSEGQAGRDEVLDLVRRHPATAADAAAGLGIPLNDAEALLENLLDANAVAASKIGDRTYYTATR